jgi:hypothetical protein
MHLKIIFKQPYLIRNLCYQWLRSVAICNPLVYVNKYISSFYNKIFQFLWNFI